MVPTVEQGLALIVKWLRHRDYSSHELCEKLQQYDFAESDCESLICQANERRWLDDNTLAQREAERLMKKGYGPLYIEQKLEKRHLSVQAIHELIRKQGLTWELCAERALAQRYSNAHHVPLPTQQRFLLRRGFHPEVIQRILPVLDELLD